MSRPPMVAPQQMVHASNAMLPNAAPLVCTLPVLSMLPASIVYSSSDCIAMLCTSLLCVTLCLQCFEAVG